MNKKYYAKQLIKLAKLLIADEIIEENKVDSIINDLTESIEVFENSGEDLVENLGDVLDYSKKNRYASRIINASDVNNLIRDCKRATIELVSNFNYHHSLKTAGNEQK